VIYINKQDYYIVVSNLQPPFITAVFFNNKNYGGKNMRTEKEFTKDLVHIMSRGRKNLMPQRIARNMEIRACEYFSYESGAIPIPTYMLYLFMQYSRMTIKDLCELFEDMPAKPSDE